MLNAFCGALMSKMHRYRKIELITVMFVLPVCGFAAATKAHIQTVVRVRPVEFAAGLPLSLAVLNEFTVQTTAPPSARAPVRQKSYQFAKVLDATATQVWVELDLCVWLSVSLSVLRIVHVDCVHPSSTWCGGVRAGYKQSNIQQQIQQIYPFYWPGV